jgi:hypothetical protein
LAAAAPLLAPSGAAGFRATGGCFGESDNSMIREVLDLAAAATAT